MRILFITNYAQLYGANRSLLSLMNYFSEQGEEVCLLVNKKGGMTEELESKGLQYIVFPYFSQVFYHKKYSKKIYYVIEPFLILATLLLLPILTYKVWRINPDLIYSNSSADNLGIIFARLLRKKHITHIRDFMDLDHDTFFVFGKKAKKNYINKSDAVIYVSRAVAKHVQLADNIPENHKVIYNGVKTYGHDYISRKVPQQINFGIVGLLDESKGQHLAIKYFNNVKDKYSGSKLHIWGDKEGPYKKRLHQMVEELGLQEDVVFHGFESELDKIYGGMSVLLMFSRMEGFGRVTVEAMQRGIPVIGIDKGGTSELVKEGYNGYLINNEEEFAAKVAQLFQTDVQYDTICHQAYEDARTNYSENVYAKNVYDFVWNLCQKWGMN